MRRKGKGKLCKVVGLAGALLVSQESRQCTRYRVPTLAQLKVSALELVNQRQRLSVDPREYSDTDGGIASLSGDLRSGVDEDWGLKLEDRL